MYVSKGTCCRIIYAYKLYKYYMSITCYVQGHMYKGGSGVAVPDIIVEGMAK